MKFRTQYEETVSIPNETGNGKIKLEKWFLDEKSKTWKVKIEKIIDLNSIIQNGEYINLNEVMENYNKEPQKKSLIEKLIEKYKLNGSEFYDDFRADYNNNYTDGKSRIFFKQLEEAVKEEKNKLKEASKEDKTKLEEWKELNKEWIKISEDQQKIKDKSKEEL